MFNRSVIAVSAVMAAGLIGLPSASHAQPGLSKLRVCGIKTPTKCLTADTRNTANGRQYRVAGGNWHSCRGDCAKTLRRNRIDFWFYQGG